jgi:hypothetical protein
MFIGIYTTTAGRNAMQVVTKMSWTASLSHLFTQAYPIYLLSIWFETNIIDYCASVPSSALAVLQTFKFEQTCTTCTVTFYAVKGLYNSCSGR